MEDKSIIDEPEVLEVEKIPKFPILVVKPTDVEKSIETIYVEEPKTLHEIIESKEPEVPSVQNLAIDKYHSEAQTSNVELLEDPKENSDINRLKVAENDDDDDEDDGINILNL